MGDDERELQKEAKTKEDDQEELEDEDTKEKKAGGLIIDVGRNSRSGNAWKQLKRKKRRESEDTRG